MATKPAKSGKQDNAETNRLARLLRTQKKQPNNKQIDAALKTTRMHRKAPVTPVWSHSWRRTAQLMRQMTGRFDPACMSSNPKTAEAAMAKPGPATLAYKPLPYPNRPFSFGARARNQYGVLVWG